MSVVNVKNRYESNLLSIRGVVGVFADMQRNRIIVLIEEPSVCQNVPSMIEGYAVECRVVGEIRG